MNGEEINNNQKKIIIYLCDLTHTAQQIANDTIPLRIGVLASYLNKTLADKVKIKLFKYPEDLDKNLKERAPDIIGFSNYIWNSNLNYGFAKRLKKFSKNTIVVFGGPNYPLEREERIKFFKEFPVVDFYIKKEGEVAFANLVKVLLENNLSVDKTKNSQLRSVDFIKNGGFVETELLPRIKNLDEIDSPYLTGVLDDFFDGKLTPLIQTDRGCPFTCTYCVEGCPYYCNVSRYSKERIKQDIDYIAKYSGKIHGLRISNSNFGMYPQDLETAREITRVRSETGWPGYVNVATGKGNKDLVLALSKILGGGLRVAASIQSTDPEVLKNIHRQNVSLEEIFLFAKESQQIGSNVYSEIILGLPGDTKEAFLKSLEDIVELDLNIILVYTLMFLDGSELGTQKSFAQYGFVPKYRILPRCFGEYDILGKKCKVAEVEKVGVANNTLSFKDYLECRAFFLVLNLFYNDGLFDELVSILKRYHISTFQWLKEIFALVNKNGQYPGVRQLFGEFVRETEEELWNSKEELKEFINREGVLAKLINGELGSNLTYKYKALGFVKHNSQLREIAFRAARNLLADSKIDDSEREMLDELLKELKRFNLLRKEHLFDVNRNTTEEFSFNFLNLSEIKNPNASINNLREKVKIEFFHDEGQRNSITKNLALYGENNPGITRILAQTYVKKIFRKAIKVS